MPEDHLDVFKNRSELYLKDGHIVFREGPQSSAAKERHKNIRATLDAGYLDNLLTEIESGKTEFSDLGASVRNDIKELVDSISSDAGRALTIVMFTQFTVKSIEPNQCVRLHKGSSSKKKDFSWVDGISFRSIDKDFISPFLRDKRFLSINKDGGMMTRTLAENYPYSSLYKARISGPVDEWVRLLDGLEKGEYSARSALGYLMSLLLNRSKYFDELVDRAVGIVNLLGDITIAEAVSVFDNFLSKTMRGARAFEVTMHSFMQAVAEIGGLEAGKELRPLSQMRSANAKAGNVGDIEIIDGGVVVESWDAKYGKYYLYEELEELGTKLPDNPAAAIVGFVCDGEPILKSDVLDKKKEIGKATNTQIEIFSFDKWVQFQCGNLNAEQKQKIGRHWIVAAVESFSLKRPELAPIGEPCDGWLTDLTGDIQDFLLIRGQRADSGPGSHPIGGG